MKIPETVIFGDIEYSDPRVMNRKPYHQRRIPIMATIANANISAVEIQQMMEAGMNLTKFKMMASAKEELHHIHELRKAAEACSLKHGVMHWPIGTCVSLKTCIATTGLIEQETSGYIPIEEASEVILTCDVKYFDKCNAKTIFFDYKYLIKDVKVGNEIYIDGDEIVVVCEEIVDEESLRCIVKKGGNLRSGTILCVRGITHTRPYLRKRDFSRIKFGLDHKFDILIVNYVRHPETIRKVKEYIDEAKVRRPLIISGICSPSGLENIDEILKESDAIILAREFLYYEIEESQMYRFGQIQKLVAAKCMQAGKPLYISGDILTSVLDTGEPTDNEIMDVANAVLDGVTGFILRDCVKVSFALKAIATIHDICCDIEPYTNTKTNFWSLTDQLKLPLNAAEAVLMSCVTLANAINAKAIIVPTVTGRSAQVLVRMRPTCLVLAVCGSPRVTTKLHLYRTVVPLLYSKQNHTVESRIQFALEYGVKRGWLTFGENYIILQRSDGNSFCDTVLVHTVKIFKREKNTCAFGDEVRQHTLLEPRIPLFVAYVATSLKMRFWG